MPAVSISTTIASATRSLDAQARKQVPFATARALTALAFKAQAAERTAILGLFAHPRPFTQRATLVDKATKGHLVATVRIRPEAVPYIAPYEFGGLHNVPGRGINLLEPVGIRLDQYGQVRGKPRSIGDRANVFVGTVQTKVGPVWGFWQRLKGKKGGPHLRLLLRAEAATSVHGHLHFIDRAIAIVRVNAAAVFGAELSKALQSTKK